MNRPLKIFAVALCIFVLCTQPLLAWNKAGHMLTAAVAFQVLKAEHPETIAKVIALLKEHPHFEERWADRLDSVDAAQKDEYLFMLAARWPDDVRNDPDFHMEKWHYINFPYKPAGQPDSLETAPPDWENIIRAYQLNKKTVTDSEDQEELAISLCWLFHLTGDVHQPLHVATLFTTDFPHGDRGGTHFYVRANGTRTSLHKLWDESVMKSEKFRSVHSRATGFLAREEFKRAQLPELVETDFEKWAQVESMKLARDVAYRHGELSGSPDEASAPELPGEYIAKANKAAERRAALAGFRLADTLRKLFE
jgi:hypothetical protein